MSEWQPIETAPDEGRFLVFGGAWRGEWSGDVDAPGVTLVERWSEAFSVAGCEYYSPEIAGPTHWMPLPDPPSE